MILSRAALEGRISYEDLTDTAYSCMLCGFCNAKCALYPVDVFIALRCEIWRRGLAPEGIMRVVSNIVEHDNPYGFRRDERGSWANSVTGKGSALFFPGCVYAFLYPKILRSSYELLRRIGVDVAYIPEADHCCGYPAYIAGDFETFQKIAHRNYRVWKSLGIKSIYTPCPGCYKTLSKHYPEFVDAFDIDVRHVMLSIHEAYDSGRVSFERKYGVVTYHDPCELTRYMHVVEEPRKLIEAISSDFVEMEYHGYFSRCCGGGGLVSAYKPSLYLAASTRRVAEAVATGAEILTTYCPTCDRTLQKGIKKAKAKITLMDLGELLLRALITQ